LTVPAAILPTMDLISIAIALVVFAALYFLIDGLDRI
jgi:hypothetical protein